MTASAMVCTACGASYPFASDRSVCTCGGTLLVEYDLEEAGRTMTKQALAMRGAAMWRYRELLPVRSAASIVSLGEGWTPLSRVDASGAGLAVRQIWLKREEMNPTGSFKARGLSSAVSLLRERGVRRAAIASNGNAATALAAYAAHAGIEAYVFVPEDCPPLIVRECMRYGARTFRVRGLIHDAGQWVEAGRALYGWTSVSTLKEPGRAEGKKTMGFELAEQLGWRLPSVIVYPTGGGSGIIGMWKAFNELIALGYVSGPLPRMVSVQEAGCAPLVSALGKHVRSSAEPAATGMRVPRPPDIGLLLRILKETDGTAVAVERGEIEAAQRLLGTKGISASPEGAATWAGLLRLHEEGWLRQDDEVVLFNTAHALPYEMSLAADGVPLLTDLHEIGEAMRQRR